MTSKESGILESLSRSPQLLKEFIQQSPQEWLKDHRIAGKWSIHEHACHLSHAEGMLLQRAKVFRDNEQPQFESYIPGETVSSEHLIDLDLHQELERFKNLRRQLISMVESFQPEIWEKEADHAEYRRYTVYIMLRHMMLHDHYHLYRIEELSLTKRGMFG